MRPHLSLRRRVLALVLIMSLGPALACSRSTEDAERRGLVVEPEVAVPESPKELRETEEKRRTQEEVGLEHAEQKRFDQIEERAEKTSPPPGP